MPAVTLHIDNLRGINAHHQWRNRVQGLRPGAAMAVELDPRAAGTVPSTKGTL
ncbi:hypothetical protein [Cupriavidus sp. USMAHM13]|uniref:hypothetical protein n=1 Tax=Cupriavidus sp. USMAHM13 TaxID=1389192 RepID=UPI000A92E1A7